MLSLYIENVPNFCTFYCSKDSWYLLLTFQFVKITYITVITYLCFQGFLCPMCMKSFNNPEALQRHFDAAHNESPSPPPVQVSMSS